MNIEADGAESVAAEYVGLKKEEVLERVAKLKARAEQAAAASQKDAAALSKDEAAVAAADAPPVSDEAGKEEASATHEKSHEDHHDEHEEHHSGQHEYEEEEDLSLEDIYNPRNLTWDELEMLLFEWEEENESVDEYLDMRVIEKLRSGEHDDEWESEDESEDEGEEGEKKSWLEKMKEKVVTEDASGTKTKVEFKKGSSTAYLNLTDDAAHVVEFYAPW